MLPANWMSFETYQVQLLVNINKDELALESQGTNNVNIVRNMRQTWSRVSNVYASIVHPRESLTSQGYV
jgi:hypothetical protein